ncbi:hypothetical protein EBZ80_10550 [bacterium]|nr:hypothetical protein [bacterium]
MDYTYNIAKHQIESPDGLVLAKLTKECSADTGYKLADALNSRSNGHLGKVDRLRAGLQILSQSAAPNPPELHRLVDTPIAEL